MKGHEQTQTPRPRRGGRPPCRRVDGHAFGRSRAAARRLARGGGTITDYYRQNVYDPADQKIGEIVDLLIEKDGQVPATMISVGGFLALTKKVVAIPFTALQVTLKERRPYLVLDIDKRALQSAPGFEFNRSARRWERVEEEQ
jgi:hypothetical protein